jgi:hypothetical protein
MFLVRDVPDFHHAHRIAMQRSLGTRGKFGSKNSYQKFMWREVRTRKPGGHTLGYLLAVSGFTMVYTAAFGICCRFYTKVFTPPSWVAFRLTRNIARVYGTTGITFKGAICSTGAGRVERGLALSGTAKTMPAFGRLRVKLFAIAERTSKYGKMYSIVLIFLVRLIGGLI